MFPMMTLLLLFAYCNCQFDLVQDEEYSRGDALIQLLNERRENISAEMGADLFVLNRDESLETMARRATDDNCDDSDLKVEGFSKVIFNLTMDLTRTEFRTYSKTSIPLQLTPDQERMLSPEHIRIGCSFKVCSLPNQGLYNNLCFLGPRNGQKSCSGICKEPDSVGNLEKEAVRVWNSRRRGFAERVYAGNMYEMTWNHLLQRNASLIAQNCGKSLPGFAVRFDLEYLPIAPAEQGKELAERFLSSKQSVRRQESELYIPYQWDNTKIGCAHAPKCQKIICVFGGPNSILFLIVQCATLEYTLVAEAPNEETMATEVLASLNGARKLVNHRIGADIRWLKWDLSLAWMASKASCDSVDGSIRLRLSQGPTGYLVDDVTTNIKNFTDHILKNGADPANATEEFSKYYEFYRSDLTRVGCAFKFCQGTGEETNLICFLGPRTQKDGPIFEMADKCDSYECRDSMCIESPFDWNAQTEEEFQAHVLKEFNGARSRFSLKAEVTSMSKLVWDDELTQSLNETGCPENGTIEFPLVGGDLFLGMAGGLAELGDMFGETSVEESSNEVYQWTSLYTILWPQMTKVGCIRPPDCSTSVLCQFGDISELTGKMFEKGVTCSKCPQGCEDGLCT